MCPHDGIGVAFGFGGSCLFGGVLVGVEVVEGDLGFHVVDCDWVGWVL